MLGSLHHSSLSEGGTYMCAHVYGTVDPPNKGHFGDSINPADLFFVERFSSFRGSKCIGGIILGL